MRFLVLLALYSSLVKAQPESLKNTLVEAEARYKVTFAYDDRFASKYLSFAEPLPQNLKLFLDILRDDYKIRVSPREYNYVLFPNPESKNNSLCGYVRSHQLAGGIREVLIIVDKQFTYSDSSGYFSFDYLANKKGTLQLIAPKSNIEWVNFNTSSFCEEYFIDQQEIKLGEVVVKYIIPPIEKRNNGTYEINLRDLTTSPGSVNPDVLELLQLLPGVSNPNENNGIFIRGGTPDQNKIIWNNVRIYQNHHANGGLSSLNPFSIDKIQLMVKGVPAIYGEHTSGIVFLKNQPREEDPVFSASAGFNLLDSDMALKFKNPKKYYFNFSARSSYKNALSQNFKENTFNRFLEANEQSTTFSDQEIYYNDFTISSGLSLGEFSKADLYAFCLKDRIDYELYNANIEFRDHLDARNDGLGLHYNYSKAQHVWDINLSYSTFDMNYKRFLEEYADEEQNDDDANYKGLSQRLNEVTETNVMLLYSNSNNPNHVFLWGAEYLYRKVFFKNQPDLNRSENDIFQSANEKVYAFFTTVKSRFSEHHFLELGMRYNYFNSVKIHRLEPRVNYTQNLNSKWTLQATFESKSQSIYRSNEAINNSADKTNNLWIGLGNALYPLLKSTQISMGTLYKHNSLVLELDTYLRRLDGITTFSFGYLDPNDQDYHTGNSAILGLDFFFQKKWKNAIFWLSYTHQENQNRFSDVLEGRSFNSNFLVRNHLNVGYNISLENWHLHLNYNLRTGIPYSKPDSFNKTETGYTFVFNNLNNHFLPDYQRIDFSLSKRFLFSEDLKIDFKMAFQNLAKNKNILERIHYFDSKAESIKKIDRYAMIPFVNVGLRFYLN